MLRVCYRAFRRLTAELPADPAPAWGRPREAPFRQPEIHPGDPAESAITSPFAGKYTAQCHASRSGAGAPSPGRVGGCAALDLPGRRGAYHLFREAARGGLAPAWNRASCGLEVSADMTVHEVRVIPEPVSGYGNNAFTCGFPQGNLCEWSSISKRASLPRLTA